MLLQGYGSTIIYDTGLGCIREPSAEAIHVASSADGGMEVRLHEETHDSSHRSRCADSVRGVRGSGLCADDECYNQHHFNGFKQHEQHKWAPRAAPRTVARHAKSEHESQHRLPQQSSEARADDVVQATSHRPEERPAERPQTGGDQLV